MFKRYFFGSANEGSFDRQGRVLVPTSLRKAAHLEKEVVLVGVQDRVEIWDKALWEEKMRMADMMAGIISKLLKALCDELHYHSIAEGVEKKLLNAKWFQLNETQLDLYKRLYKIICEWDNVWYKSYAGIYSDDLVCFIGLLGYMTHFENKEQIINEKLEMQGEYFNGYVCQQLSDYFNRRRSKLPIDFIDKNDEEYFLNRRGAKVYFDITKQPVFEIAEGSQTEMVLSVGMDKLGIPLF